MDYFQRLFTAGSCPSHEEVLDMLNPYIIQQMNDQLLASFGGAEIQQALNQMLPTKGHGTDGMPALFSPKLLACCREGSD